MSKYTTRTSNTKSKHNYHNELQRSTRQLAEVLSLTILRIHAMFWAVRTDSER